jgi:hypothetical protein
VDSLSETLFKSRQGFPALPPQGRETRTSAPPDLWVGFIFFSLGGGAIKPSSILLLGTFVILLDIRATFRTTPPPLQSFDTGNLRWNRRTMDVIRKASEQHPKPDQTFQYGTAGVCIPPKIAQESLDHGLRLSLTMRMEL